MKSKIYLTIFLCSVLTFLSRCNKDIELTEQLTANNPTNLDVDAETWLSVDANVITLSKITNIVENSSPVVFSQTPKAVNDPDYLAELAAVKDAQSKLTGAQKNSIEYWSAGGVIRWNQILRELVARYNLPPMPGADGLYLVPDAENPFATAGFPFSNPPYAARSYSYVAAAQYEALKTAWHYMYQFKRPAPYNTDAAVIAFVPKNNLPAYPSYDAVLSGVTAEMLKLLFPAALEEITLKATEQRNAALWSGKAVKTDIDAGLALGKSVAALFIARAKGDKTGAAGGDKAKWKTLANNATTRSDTAWHSLEVPARPPMLPFFGNVSPWIMTSGEIIALRPPAPPMAGSEKMIQENVEVKWFSSNLTRERLAIVHKWADGVSTYTPPGHWNDIATEYIHAANFSEVRTARAYALLNMTLHNASIACWDTKYFYFNARPTQLDASIKTGTGIPNFPSYVSGHSTYSASAATFLSYMFPDGATTFHGMAQEAAMSRLYGAIHSRTDCMVGLDLGSDIGDYMVTNFAKLDGAD